jgi:hypothetical protein
LAIAAGARQVKNIESMSQEVAGRSEHEADAHEAAAARRAERSYRLSADAVRLKEADDLQDQEPKGWISPPATGTITARPAVGRNR